ncbi:alanine--tRNA ligase/DNA-binding transcriptional repressor [Gammaproteobacteria bacterium]
MTSAEIRSAFLDYFRNQGHTFVASSSLVPGDDPTLLFTNAGMVQFKDVFLGLESRSYVRAASSQRCVRAGGKHNDLENVGYTARHHTFFEMLGNFSFGDYFKHDAIHYAWNFLTQVLKLPPTRLWVTVYTDDDEAANLWLNDIGVDPNRLSRCGAKDNFWSMGDTGPCGPCSEIFYDHGPEIAGGPPGSPDADGDRYIEIWNLVFMQYDRARDGTLTPLPKPSVDTGMGLERLTAVLQGVHNNYDTDLFTPLTRAAAELAGVSDLSHTSLKVVADHIRAASFLITDGVLPSNEGRGYVLRRIVRRALRHGHQLGLVEPFFYRLVQPLTQVMGDAYPELVTRGGHVEQVLRQEEERFAQTLDQGMTILHQEMASLSPGAVIAGEVLFRLYDTYGFPVDLTADVARERGYTVDLPGFELEMEAQRNRARAASRFQVGETIAAGTVFDTSFHGYTQLDLDGARVLALYHDQQPVAALEVGKKGVVVLEATPFYAESGGQAGDRGILEGAEVRFVVEDTVKLAGKMFGHVGTLTHGCLQPGAVLLARVDVDRRRATALNHSATHLLHAALRRVLGSHVSQKGSLVDATRLRFDFSHYQSITATQLHEIEDLTNAQVRANLAVETQLMPVATALASGAMALFGEKYGDEVRVLRMGDFSVELCGGTHVAHTGDIGFIKVIAESGIAAGVRRIEAVTGATAVAFVRDTEERLIRVAELVKGSRDTVEERVVSLAERSRRLEKEVERLKEKLAAGGGSASGELAAVDMSGIKVLAMRMEGVDAKSLRTAVDRFKDKLGEAVVILGTVENDKVSLIAGVTKTVTTRIRAGDLMAFVAERVGGKGGGRPDMAQGGGPQVGELDGALAAAVGWVRERLEISALI